MLLSHLLMMVGEISFSKFLMPEILLGRAMSMLMFPLYGS